MVKKIRKPKPQPKQKQVVKPKLGDFLQNKKAESSKKIKKKNIHHFEGFYERIKKIDIKHYLSIDEEPKEENANINIQENIDNQNALLTSTNCNFLQILSSQKLLTTSLNFRKFIKEIFPLSMSLPMIIHNLPRIIEIMQKEVEEGDAYCKLGILELLIGLIKDMRSEIYPIFIQEIMPTLIHLIDHKNINLMDKVFSVFTYAFKYLIKDILQDIGRVYRLFFELLMSNNDHIRGFSSQCMAYVFRKVATEGMGSVIHVILRPFRCPQEYVQIAQNIINNREEPPITQIDRLILNIPSTQTPDELEDLLLDEISRSKIITYSIQITPLVRIKLIRGIALVVTEVVKGVNNSLFHKGAEILYELYAQIYSDKENILELFLISRSINKFLIQFLQFNDFVLMNIMVKSFGNIFHYYCGTNLHSDIISKTLNSTKDNSQSHQEFIFHLLILIMKDWMHVFHLRMSNSLSIGILEKVHFLVSKNRIIFDNFPLIYQRNILSLLSIFALYKQELVAKIYNTTSKSGGKLDALLFTLNPQIISYFMHSMIHPKMENSKFETILETKKRNKRPLSDVAINYNYKSCRSIIGTLYKSYTKALINKLINDPDYDTVMLLICHLLHIRHILNIKSPIKVTDAHLAKIQELYQKIEENNYSNNYNKNLNLIIYFEFISCVYIVNNEFWCFQKVLELKTEEKQNKNSQSHAIEDYGKFDDYSEDLNNVIRILYNFENKEQSISTHTINYHLSVVTTKVLLTSLRYYINKGEQNLTKELIENIIMVKKLIFENPLHNLENTSALYEILYGLHSSGMIQKYYLLNIQENNMFKDIYIPETQKFKTSTEFGEIIEEVHPILVSNNHENKLNVLKILNYFEYEHFEIKDLKNEETEGADKEINKYYIGECNIIELMLKCEKLEIDLSNSKEKIGLMTKIQNMIKSGNLSQKYQIIALNFLVGCFWVKFRPLQLEAEKCIEDLFKRYENSELFVEYLNKLRLINFMMYRTENNHPRSEALSHDYLEETILIKESTAYVEIQKVLNNYSQIMKSIILNISKENLQKFIQLFNSFIFIEYNKYCTEIIPLSQPETEKAAIEYLVSKIRETQNQKNDLEQEKQKLCRNKLQLYLEILAEIPNISCLENVKEIKDISFKLLIDFQEGVQKASLKCQQNFEIEEINEYKEALERLADDGEFMEGLSSFPIDIENTQIKSNHREYVIKVVIRLLYSKLLKKRGKINKKHINTRKNSIFMFLNGLTREEINYLVECLLNSIGLSLSTSHIFYKQIISECEFSKLQGFLVSSKILFKQLGQLITDYVLILANILLDILYISRIFIQDNNHLLNLEDNIAMCDVYNAEGVENQDEENNRGTYLCKMAKNVHRQGIAIIKIIFQKYSQLGDFAQIMDMFISRTSEQIKAIKLIHSQGKSHLLEIYLAWSEVPEMIKYFKIYPQILNNLIELLGNKGVSINVVWIVIQIIENIIQKQGGENDNMEETPQLNILMDDINLLTLNIQKYIKHHSIKDTKEMRGLFNILSQITLNIIPKTDESYKSNEFSRMDLFNLLLSFIQNPKIIKFKHSEQLLSNLFITMKNIGSAFPNSEKNIFYHSLLPLLMKLKIGKARHQLAVLLGELVNEKECSKAIINLNTCNKIGLTLEPDFDLIINEMNEINRDWFGAKTFNILHPILMQYLYLITNSDFAVRSGAIHGINLYITSFVSKFQNKLKEYLSSYEASSNAEKTESNVIEEEFTFFTEYFLDQLTIALLTKDELITKSILETFHHYISAIYSHIPTTLEPSVFNPLYTDLKCLYNKDPNQDIFLNLLHLQLHKRFKALRNLDSLIAKGFLSENSLMRVILPIINLFIIFQGEGERANKGIITYRKGGYGRQVMEDAINVLGSIAGVLGWENYNAVLKRFLHLIQKKGKGREALLLHSICSILKNFHFQLPDAIDTFEYNIQLYMNNIDEINAATPPNHPQKVLEENAVVNMLLSGRFPKCYEVVELKESKNMGEGEQKIITTIENKIVRVLRGHMMDISSNENASNSIRSNVAIAISKIIRKLPVPAFHTHYLRIMTNISQTLRNREFTIREKAREALCEIVSSTSPYLLPLVVDELSRTLNRGYMRHILNYTLNQIFSSILGNQDSKAHFVGKLSGDCIHKISLTLTEEITGDLKEEREAGVYSGRYKEAKRVKYSACYYALSQLIGVSALKPLVSPLKNILKLTPPLSVISKVEELLSRIMNGLRKNSLFDVNIQIYMGMKYIKKGLKMNAKENVKDININTTKEYIREGLDSRMEKTYGLQIEAGTGKRIIQEKSKNAMLSANILSTFGMLMVNNALNSAYGSTKSKTADECVEVCIENIYTNNTEVQMNIEEIIESITECLSSKHNRLLFLSMKALFKLISHPTQIQNESLLHTLISKIFDLVYSLVYDPSDLWNSIFDSLTHIISNPKYSIKLDETQNIHILEIISANLESSTGNLSMLLCARAIIKQRVLSSHVFDIAEILLEIIITGHVMNVKQIAQQIFIDFMLFYPMDAKRHRQHINYILKNLGFERVKGRLAIIELLNKLIVELPSQIIDDYSEIMLVTIILRIINDPSYECRIKAGEAAKELMKSISKSKLSEFIHTILLWFQQGVEYITHGRISEANSPKLGLFKISQHLLGMIIEVYPKKLKQKGEIIEDNLGELFTYEVHRSKLVEGEELPKLEKEDAIYEEISVTEKEKELRSVLEHLELITPEHKNELHIDKLIYLGLIIIEKQFIHYPARIMNLFISDDGQLKQGKYSLFYTIILFINHPHYWVKLSANRILGLFFSKISPNKFSNLDIWRLMEGNFFYLGVCEVLVDLFESKLLEAQLGIQLIKNLVFCIKCLAEVENGGLRPAKFCEMETLGGKTGINKIFNRLSGIGRRMMKELKVGVPRLTELTKLISVCTHTLPNCLLEEVVSPILDLVQRTSIQKEFQETEIRTISMSIIEILQRKLDSELFISAYSQVKNQINLKKQGRKNITKQQAIVNPELYAQKMEKKRSKKKESRKRKNMEFSGIKSGGETKYSKKSKLN